MFGQFSPAGPVKKLGNCLNVLFYPIYLIMWEKTLKEASKVYIIPTRALEEAKYYDLHGIVREVEILRKCKNIKTEKPEVVASSGPQRPRQTGEYADIPEEDLAKLKKAIGNDNMYIWIHFAAFYDINCRTVSIRQRRQNTDTFSLEDFGSEGI